MAPPNPSDLPPPRKRGSGPPPGSVRPAIPVKPGVPAKPIVVSTTPAAVPAKPLLVPTTPVVVAAKPIAVPAKVGSVAPVAPKPVPVAPPAAAKPPTVAPPAPSAAPSAPTPPTTPSAKAAPAKPPASPAPTKPRPAPVKVTKASKPTARLSKQTKLAKGQKDALIGQVVARCKIEARIGEGRTSVVYRATHEGLNRPVAVKILLPEVLQYPEVVEKFEAEARAIAKIDHENILKIYDVATDGDRHCIVMELLEGESLLEVVEQNGPLAPLDAMRVVRQAALGLDAAHSKNIIHRDVKPQNLVLLEDGLVKVVDFGLATAADSDLAAVRIGTPHYMAPEACEAKPVEQRSDVYSLGITLYHLLVGKPPYAGLSLKEILAAHVEGRPLHPERQEMSLPKALCDLVREMTKRDPLTRIDMANVVTTLDQIGGKELKVRQGLKTRRAGRRRGGKTPVLAIGAVAFVVVVGLVVLLLSKQGGSGGGKSTKTAGGPTPDAGAPPAPPPDTNPGTGTPGGAVPPTPPPDETPTPPPAPVETEEQKKDREVREARLAEENRKGEAKKAFADAEDFARANSDDKEAVVRTYKLVAATFPGTDAAKEAKRRATAIEKGEMHPHPDRTFAKAEDVDSAVKKWEDAKKLYEEDLAAGKYVEAKQRIPEGIDDREGRLSEELGFWRTLANDLMAFRIAFRKEVMALPEASRTLKLEKGEGTVQDATEAGLHVIVDGELKTLSWSQVPLEPLTQLATRAFANKDSKSYALFAEFAFAHKQKGAFWGAALTAQGSGTLPRELDQQVSRCIAHAEERFK